MIKKTKDLISYVDNKTGTSDGFLFKFTIGIAVYTTLITFINLGENMASKMAIHEYKKQISMQKFEALVHKRTIEFLKTNRCQFSIYSPRYPVDESAISVPINPPSYLLFIVTTLIVISILPVFGVLIIYLNSKHLGNNSDQESTVKTTFQKKTSFRENLISRFNSIFLYIDINSPGRKSLIFKLIVVGLFLFLPINFLIVGKDLYKNLSLAQKEKKVRLQKIDEYEKEESSYCQQ